VLYIQPISSIFISSPCFFLAKNTYCGASHYAVCSTPVLRGLSWVQVFSLPSGQETQFYTHVIKQVSSHLLYLIFINHTESVPNVVHTNSKRHTLEIPQHPVVPRERIKGLIKMSSVMKVIRIRVVAHKRSLLYSAVQPKPTLADAV
jgi:hypothetical protein